MINLLASLIPGLFKLGDKMIEDKDAKLKYAFKVQEMAQEMGMKLIETKTYPWIDGLVKMAYASEAIVKGLFRPIISTIAMGFVAYCELKGIEISQTVEAVLIALLPGWMYSRHKDKQGPPHIDT